MNTSMKLLGALAALAAGTSLFAQTTPVVSSTGSAAAGFLGKRYVEGDFAYVDVRHSGINGKLAGAMVNVPLNAYVDLSADYAHAWIDSWSNVGDSLGFSATGYMTSGQLKPYASASLNYVWSDFDDDFAWGARGGVEYSVSPKLAYAVSVGYDDDFKGGTEGIWDAEVRAVYAFTEKISGTATFSFAEGGDRTYGLGVLFRF